MKQILKPILCCPKCRALPEQGLQVDLAHCSRCNTNFFDLNGLPCWFANGLEQKAIWQHLFADFVTGSEQVMARYEDAWQAPGLPASSMQRIERYAELQRECHQGLQAILSNSGLEPLAGEKYQGLSSKGLIQYYQLILRDWAWCDIDREESARRYQDENLKAFESILSVASEIEGKVSRVLVVGSGAGRLSWDLHCHLQPELTVSFDANPLLSSLSKQVVADKQSLKLVEANKFPRKGLPERLEWTLSLPDRPEPKGEWLAMAGDAWAMPFQDASFDLVVTPWFLDICGSDIRYLLPIIENLLVPGGYWLNQGPFLYPDELGENLKYTAEEIRDLSRRARFDLRKEQFQETPYTFSPLSERGRIESMWSFLARSSASREHLVEGGECINKIYRSDPPDWLVLPHLPIPRLNRVCSFPEWLKGVASLIDGTRSINDLVTIISATLPEGHDPAEYVYGMLEEFVLTDQ